MEKLDYQKLKQAISGALSQDNSVRLYAENFIDEAKRNDFVRKFKII